MLSNPQRHAKGQQAVRPALRSLLQSTNQPISNVALVALSRPVMYILEVSGFAVSFVWRLVFCWLTNRPLCSNSRVSWTARCSHGRPSWLASPWASMCWKGSCLSGSIRSCSDRSRLRCWRMRCRRRCTIKVRYAPPLMNPSYTWGKKKSVGLIRIVLRSRKSQVQLRCGSLRSGSKSSVYLWRFPPQVLGLQWLPAVAVSSCSVPG